MQLVFADFSEVKVPSGATMSRARAKVDAALMVMRQYFWRSHVRDRSIQLGFLTCFLFSHI